MHRSEGLPSRTCRAWEGCPEKLQLGARRAQVEELLERGVYDMKELAEGGWLTALRYEDEVIADLKKRTGGKASKVRAVRRGSLFARLERLSRLLNVLSCRPSSHTGEKGEVLESLREMPCRAGWPEEVRQCVPIGIRPGRAEKDCRDTLCWRDRGRSIVRPPLRVAGWLTMDHLAPQCCADASH